MKVSGEHAVAGLLHDEIAGEAVRGLDNDGSDAITGDAFEHLAEGRAIFNWVHGTWRAHKNQH